VYVDIAGNQDVLFDVHTHLSGVLAHSMVVGNTNWNTETTANAAALPAPAPEFLFAPTHGSINVSVADTRNELAGL
jgi:hypothetical protein